MLSLSIFSSFNWWNHLLCNECGEAAVQRESSPHQVTSLIPDRLFGWCVFLPHLSPFVQLSLDQLTCVRFLQLPFPVQMQVCSIEVAASGSMSLVIFSSCLEPEPISFILFSFRCVSFSPAYPDLVLFLLFWQNEKSHKVGGEKSVNIVFKHLCLCWC